MSEDQRDFLAPNAIQKQFPLYLFEDFDSSFPNIPWTIGLKTEYPPELFRRVAAAGISLALGNKSIDHVYKTYTKEMPYEHSNRLDKDIYAWIIIQSDNSYKCLDNITHREESSPGRILFEWTLLRIPFAIKMTLACANRGSIFETATLVRMALEQIAWAFTIDDRVSIESIQRTSATRAITELRGAIPYVGRLYGWLSRYAHWESSAHVNAMISDDRRLGIQFASSLYKAQGYLLSIIIIVLLADIILLKRNSLIAEMNDDESINKIISVKNSSHEYAQMVFDLHSGGELSAISDIFSKIAEG